MALHFVFASPDLWFLWFIKPVVLSHVPPGQLALFDAYFGEILLSQLRTPVHWNASFESPPSSFPLSTLAALVHTHTGTNTGEKTLTGDFSHTKEGFVLLFCCFSLNGQIDPDGNWTYCQKMGGCVKTDACWWRFLCEGIGGVRVHSPKQL